MSTSDMGEQMHTAVKAWLDAQKQIGESWLRAVSPFMGSDDRPRPLEGQPGETVGTSGASAASASLSEGLVAGYRAMARMFELSLSTFVPPGWSPRPDGASAGPSGFGEFLRPPQQWMPWAFGPWKAGPGNLGVSTSWFDGIQELYRDGFQKWAAPWFEALRPPDEAASKADGRSVLSQFTDLYWDAYERTMGRLLESPDVGHRREFDERLLQTFRAWVEFRRASFDYLGVLGEAWMKTLTEMMSELESMARDGKAVGSLSELLRLWTKVADRVLIDTFGKEEYARVQGRLLNAAMAYRVEERRTADVFLRMSHVPSRTELDEVTRELHQLRRELREVRRGVAERKRDAPAPRKARASAKNAKRSKKPAESEDVTQQTEHQTSKADVSEGQQDRPKGGEA